MKIGFFQIEGWEEEKVRAVLGGHELFFSKEKIMPFSLPETRDFDIISIFTGSRLDADTLSKFPNLKFIATRSTGFDHIDLAEAQAQGISVAYVPGYGDHTVAEYTFGLLLALTRKIYEGVEQVKKTGSFSLAGLRGTELRGKNIGVIGTGRIGREVVRLAKAFQMNLYCYDIYPSEDFAKEIGATYLPLSELLAASDVITLHCPLSPETRYLINKNNINLIKRGAYLINTARGPIVETEALVSALQSGILAGAGLDVLEEEGETRDELDFLAAGVHPQEEELRTILENHILMRMPNVFVTPHNAFNSKEAMERILSITLDNLTGYLDGKNWLAVPKQDA
jgi:D-lactate dehydrogenase